MAANVLKTLLILENEYTETSESPCLSESLPGKVIQSAELGLICSKRDVVVKNSFSAFGGGRMTVN
jgi:hypothetical protein